MLFSELVSPLVIEADGQVVPIEYGFARAYALGVNDTLLASNPWYEQWSPDPTRRQVLWQEFVRGPDPKEEVIQADDWAIGEPEFRRRLHRPESRAVPRAGRPCG